MSNKLLRISSLVGLACLGASSLWAGGIKGKVTDKETGEPLIGATVTLEHTRYATVVNLDGTFNLKHVPAGKYELEVKYVGYKEPEHVEVIIDDANGDKEVDFTLESAAKEITTITVQGAGNGTNDQSARLIEKKADNVMNLLSAKNIELSPDVTVANALQRVSGVTIQRSNTGEGRYAIIRGMDQRYNNTLVNGVKIPSPDDKYRFVPMDIFPSEMIDRLEIIKALTPNMEGDAIGGTMNLVMKNAPERFLFSVNGSGGYSTIFNTQPFLGFPHSGINKKSPAEVNGNNYAATYPGDFPTNIFNYSDKSNPINSTLGMTIGDRFLNKKLGVILSASYQNFYEGSTSKRLVPDAQPVFQPTANTLNFSDSYIRQYSTQTNRLGLQGKIDYVFNSKNTISLFGLYLHQNEYETRYTPDTTVGLNSSNTQSQLSPEYRSTWTIQNIANATLHGEHQLGEKVKLDWSGVYSKAEKKMPDQSWYSFDATVTTNNGKIVSVDSTVQPSTGIMNRVWEHNTDQDEAGYLNLTYKPRIFKRDVEFMTGGLYRYKTRTNYYDAYSLQADVQATTPFHGIDQLPLYFQTPGDAYGYNTAVGANTYTAHEKTGAGYIQAKFMVVKSLQVLGGVRVENTNMDYTTTLPETYPVGASGTVHYTDVLPSVHFKYFISENQNLRLSYFKSISRPGFGEYVPYNLPGEVFTEIGNPELKHVRADNLDLRYELFPGLTDQFLIGGFYKKLENPIEYFVTRDNSPSSLYIQPQNTNSATNIGAEVVIAKFFGKFGVSANYTYTHSRITTIKLLYHQVTTSNGTSVVTDSVNQSRPLQGQADNVGNVSFLYKDPKFGLNVQLAFAYTGSRIAQVSQYAGLDIWQKPFGQLDLSFEKRILKGFFFYAKINNLTNAPAKFFIKQPYTTVDANFKGYSIPFQDSGSNYTVAEKDMYKISYLGGLRYKF
ncbi:TonB-dependent receptor [Dinghuibacter silviterrae]|uniref:TonB-dependent receptor n=1 Tax=Dinghuibacter silviterrae TaxID=1539049 RepID=A0A4R8DNJ2_9BACT|nr:TonB-dependent receptor [Dinghuibacter silviterrae]TDW99601.1 TonB-dependent receptor [Dinghuibacter silviterrae]